MQNHQKLKISIKNFFYAQKTGNRELSCFEYPEGQPLPMKKSSPGRSNMLPKMPNPEQLLKQFPFPMNVDPSEYLSYMNSNMMKQLQKSPPPNTFNTLPNLVQPSNMNLLPLSQQSPNTKEASRAAQLATARMEFEAREQAENEKHQRHLEQAMANQQQAAAAAVAREKAKQLQAQQMKKEQEERLRKEQQQKEEMRVKEMQRQERENIEKQRVKAEQARLDAERYEQQKLINQQARQQQEALKQQIKIQQERAAQAAEKARQEQVKQREAEVQQQKAFQNAMKGVGGNYSAKGWGNVQNQQNQAMDLRQMR